MRDEILVFILPGAADGCVTWQIVDAIKSSDSARHRKILQLLLLRALAASEENGHVK